MFPLNMYRKTAFILVYLFLLSFGHEVNYCRSKMCGYTNAHTLCQFSFGQSPSCIGYIAAPLTSEEKARILARLNRRRDDAAGGRLRGFPSAGNMLKLRWVDELSREAQMWADQCRSPKTPEEHDACRDLYSTTVGQCVASVVGEAPGLRVESMVDIWFMQNMLYKGNVTMYEPSDPSKQYGDFAQIMWARTYMVGCGRSRFMVQLRGRYRTVERLVCNFAPQGPSAYRPLWTIGVPAAVCPSRSRPHAFLTSLCDYQNELNQLSDIDNSVTLEEHILLNVVLELESNKKQNRASLDDIYLTYLTLVTMENAVTTSRFNSIQKRDIVEKIRFEDVKLDTKHVELNKLDQILNKTIESKPIQTITTKIAKKLNIIGRQKAYIIEELSDVGDKTEKHHDVTEAMSKRKKEFYDYLVETSEENLTLTAEEIKLDEDFNENDIHEDNSYVTVPTMPKVHDTIVGQTNEAEVKPLNKGAIETVQQSIEIHLFNTTATYNELSVTKDKLDDYLTDPETVSQLAEALDRMEHSTKKLEQVRRDIRDDTSVEAEAQVEASEMSIVPNDITFLSDTEVLTTLNPKEELNITDDRASMLNMVLKYMPYLKPYETELIGRRTQNSASCIRPLIVLNMIVQFVLCV